MNTLFEDGNLVNVVDAASVERRASANDSVNLSKKNELKNEK